MRASMTNTLWGRSSTIPYLVPTIYYLLPTIYYLLPTTYYLLPTVCCFLLAEENHIGAVGSYLPTVVRQDDKSPKVETPDGTIYSQKINQIERIAPPVRIGRPVRYPKRSRMRASVTNSEIPLWKPQTARVGVEPPPFDGQKFAPGQECPA